jgi:prepilin-type N-terminal cleavage/methylation domain-containing protein
MELFKMKNKFTMDKRGYTLMELVVTIAVLAVVSVITVTTYTNVMANQRMKADLATLSQIDDGFKHIFLYDDAFEEVKNYVYDDNKFKVNFQIEKIEAKPSVNLEQATINDTNIKLKDECPIIYGYLVEQIDNDIELNSSNYNEGFYYVYIEFNGTKVSDVRDYVITNDNIIVTNSGDEYFD